MHTNYPRPHFDRSQAWLSLDGEWEFAPGANCDHQELLDKNAVFPRRIKVPFPWESTASGIAAAWLEQGWYRRVVEVPKEWLDSQTVLHFGGVHERVAVYVNGMAITVSEGGMGQLECDITQALRSGPAHLVVKVDNPRDKSRFCHGKQRTLPGADYDNCSFEPSSGLWQAVWMEPRPATYLRSLRLSPVPSLDAIAVEATVSGPQTGKSILRLLLNGEGGRSIPVPPGGATSTIIEVPNPQLWTPETPNLYFVEGVLSSPDGEDRVTAYTGLRKIELVGEHLHLNGRRLYVRGVLDQGYWPDSGLTAPSVEDLIKDLNLAKDAGYNLVRKHLKLEDPRWLYLADTLGMLVWAEPPSASRYSEETAVSFRDMVRRMVARDGNHPSVIIWGLYNEEWGLEWSVMERPELQEVLREAFNVARSLDPSRPIVDNSGWSHVVTDIVDWHYYESDMLRWRENIRALVTGGAASVPVALRPPEIEMKLLGIAPGVTSGRPSIVSEYGAGLTSVDRAWYLKWQTQELRRLDNLSGYIYTELYDVEYETFGVYTARRAPKDYANIEIATVNAETVIVVDVTPERPGLDTRAIEGLVEITLRVSHHGCDAVTGEILATWGDPFGVAPEYPFRLIAGRVAEITAEPFVLSDGYVLRAELPADVDAGRLHVALGCDRRVLARTCLDIVRSPRMFGAGT